MAKQGKTLPARRPREMESSLFLRSAESLGRVIGTLQRQLDSAAKRQTYSVEEAGATASTNGNHPRKTKKTKAAKTAKKTTNKTKTTRAAAKSTTKKAGAKKTTRR